VEIKVHFVKFRNDNTMWYLDQQMIMQVSIKHFGQNGAFDV